jgi:hypothetical protein
VADYGPHDSNRTEGIGLTMFIGGLVIWVAALAYAAPVLQVIMVIVGVALDLGGLFVLHQAKVAGNAERKKAQS